MERAQCHFHYTLWAKASNKTSSNLKAEEIYWKYTLPLFYLFKILIVYLNFPTSSVLLFFKKNYLFIYFWLGLDCCTDFSLVELSRGYSLAVVWRLPVAVTSLVVEQGL